jgi:hypothetical protein
VRGTRHFPFQLRRSGEGLIGPDTLCCQRRCATNAVAGVPAVKQVPKPYSPGRRFAERGASMCRNGPSIGGCVAAPPPYEAVVGGEGSFPDILFRACEGSLRGLENSLPSARRSLRGLYRFPAPHAQGICLKALAAEAENRIQIARSRPVFKNSLPTSLPAGNHALHGPPYTVDAAPCLFAHSALALMPPSGKTCTCLIRLSGCVSRYAASSDRTSTGS